MRAMQREINPPPHLVVGALVLILIGLTLPVLLGVGRYEGHKNRAVRPVCTLLALIVFFATCRNADLKLKTQADAVGQQKTQADAVGELFGVYTLLALALGLLVMNALTTIPFFQRASSVRFTTYKPNAAGALLVIGAGAVVFGFLDNYGMKLGTSALEDGIFWRTGLAALGKDPGGSTQGGTAVPAVDYTADLQAFNQFFATDNADIQKVFTDANPLDPARLKQVIDRYNAIKGSGAMLGNTFSDFAGALLGAGISTLFAHLTAIDGDIPNPDAATRIIQNPVTRVVLEACFISIGCLVPVALHFRESARDFNKSGAKAGKWLPLGLPNETLTLGAGLLVAGLVVSQVAVVKRTPAQPPEPVPDWQGKEAMATATTGVVLTAGLMAFLLWKFRTPAAANA